MQQGSIRAWSSLKGILEDALRSGIAMAENPKHESAAEDQWHAVACTVQLAVRFLGIGHCTEKVRVTSSCLAADAASSATNQSQVKQSMAVDSCVYGKCLVHGSVWYRLSVAAGQGAWHTGHLEGCHPHP